jgi:HAD superfamily hydrolase (TIGR01490 family)
VAAFDFDGTLARGDSLIPFLVSVRGRRRVGAALSALGPSIAWAMARGGDEARERAKEALVGRLLRGVPADEVAAQGEAFAAQLVEGRLRPLTAERVAWHRSEGHQLVIVSASLTAYLEPVGATLGFDQVLATSLEVGDDGRLTGRLAGGNVRGPEKAERLRAWLASASASWDASASASSDAGSAECEVWAYGDSTGDHHLFALADHPFLVGRRSITVWRT